MRWYVWEKAAEKSCSLRTAAYIVACERILLARKIAEFIRANAEIDHAYKPPALQVVCFPKHP